MDFGNICNLIEKSSAIMVLTGAGISAESGLPTFRGKDGYWIKDGKNYKPMELATYETFIKMPEIVWEWYHHRRSVYSKAEPNKAHKSLVELEEFCKENNKLFLLVTQNVDNLHQRSGIESKNIFEVHGNIYGMRCSADCDEIISQIPNDLFEGVPKCPACGENARPNVLWFDEFYDETFFNFRTVLKQSQEIDLLFIIGTTLQTTLPRNIFHNAYVGAIPIIEINSEPIGLDRYGVNVLKGKAGEILPKILLELNKD